MAVCEAAVVRVERDVLRRLNQLFAAVARFTGACPDSSLLASVLLALDSTLAARATSRYILLGSLKFTIFTAGAQLSIAVAPA